MTDETEPTPQALLSQLRTLPPGARIELTWDPTTDTDKTTTTGIITDYEPRTAYRQIETDERTLALVPAADHSELTVSEVTTAGTCSLGRLTDLTTLEFPVEEVELTDDGFDIPSYLVGYTGFLLVEDGQGRRELRIPEPGLEETDPRLLAHITRIPETVADEPIMVRPRAGPHRKYEILDTRTGEETADAIEPTGTPPDGDYTDLEPTIHTVQAITDTVDDDAALSADARTTVRRRLHTLQEALLRARRTLLDPPRTDEWSPTAAEGDTEWETYAEILAHLEERLEALHTTSKRETGSLERRQVHLTFDRARTELEELRALLTDAAGAADDPATGGVADE
ncbi:hypothetical protein CHINAEXTREME_14290 [Halobiforma lacisalsi AJ5]|uniref:Uncharacterized protein n=1 Tax=Natronobacterium lacisalsi AJ5 TaxID=358396 RepID=M0L5H4_NATLA|nr:hypothetical protein [Halobiforma lacisalsi]APW98873.1 hypothetical protein CHINAEXTREME_14290 [Halobiforma lacisalsi AJ5]EMA27240.1 hypothetical protein C445_21126 [Halobiforma lacisalsi AJ5]